MEFFKKIFNSKLDLVTNIFVGIAIIWLFPVIILYLISKFFIGLPINWIIGKLK